MQDNAAQAGHSFLPTQPFWPTQPNSFGQSPVAPDSAPGQSQPAMGGYKPSQPTPSQGCVSAGAGWSECLQWLPAPNLGRALTDQDVNRAVL